MPKKKVQLLALHTGYVETSYTATVLLYHDEGFKSVEEAVADFAAAFREGCQSFRDERECDIKLWEKEVARFHTDGARAILLEAQQDVAATDCELAYRYTVSSNQDRIALHVWESLVSRGWNLALDSYDTKPVKLPTVYGVADWPRLFDPDYEAYIPNPDEDKED